MPRHEYREPPLRERRRARDGSGDAGPDPAAVPYAVRPVVRGPGPAPRSSQGDGAEGGWAGRMLVVTLLVIALAVPFAVTASQLWSHTGEEITTAQDERDGVTYLRPLVRLLAAAADQQSSDIAGTPGDGQALRDAIRDVDRVDAELGPTLGVHDRWVSVRQRLGALADAPPPAGSAYQAFGQATDLILALISVVGDRSTLILDPDLDTYYLMDVTLLRLPDILVNAGRLSDRGRTASAIRGPEVAVLADEIRRQSAALDTSMRKSFAATRTATVTGDLVTGLDRFGDAVTTLTPPVAGVGGITDFGGRLQADRTRARDTGLALEDAALARLDSLLQARIDAVSGQRRLVAVIVLVGVALALLAGWLLWRRRRPEHREPVPDATRDRAPASLGAGPEFGAAQGTGTGTGGVGVGVSTGTGGGGGSGSPVGIGSPVGVGGGRDAPHPAREWRGER